MLKNENAGDLRKMQFKRAVKRRNTLYTEFIIFMVGLFTFFAVIKRNYQKLDYLAQQQHQVIKQIWKLWKKKAQKHMIISLLLMSTSIIFKQLSLKHIKGKLKTANYAYGCILIICHHRSPHGTGNLTRNPQILKFFGLFRIKKVKCHSLLERQPTSSQVNSCQSESLKILEGNPFRSLIFHKSIYRTLPNKCIKIKYLCISALPFLSKSIKTPQSQALNYHLNLQMLRTSKKQSFSRKFKKLQTLGR